MLGGGITIRYEKTMRAIIKEALRLSRTKYFLSTNLNSLRIFDPEGWIVASITYFESIGVLMTYKNGAIIKSLWLKKY